MKNKKHITWKQGLWIAVLLIVFIILLRSLYTLYLRFAESTADMKNSETALAALTDREQNLVKETANLKTDRGQEEEVRTRYNMSRPGEQLVVIMDDATTTATTTPQKVGWWQSVKDFFFK